MCRGELSGRKKLKKSLLLALLSYESWVFVKEKPDWKKIGDSPGILRNFLGLHAACHFNKMGHFPSMLHDFCRYFNSTWSPKKHCDYRNWWNLIKTTIIVIFPVTSDKFFLSRLPDWLFPVRINTKHHTKHWTRSVGGVLSIYLICKMLLGKKKKEYFGRKIKRICCIYVLPCINCDEEWQGSYENPNHPVRYTSWYR